MGLIVLAIVILWLVGAINDLFWVEGVPLPWGWGIVLLTCVCLFLIGCGHPESDFIHIQSGTNHGAIIVQPPPPPPLSSLVIERCFEDKPTKTWFFAGPDYMFGLGVDCREAYDDWKKTANQQQLAII